MKDSNLTAIIPSYGCESVGVYLEEVRTDASTTVVTPIASGFITGVGAPTSTANGWITGVGAPSGNATMTGGMPGFTGAAEKLGVTDALTGIAVGAMAAFL